MNQPIELKIIAAIEDPAVIVVEEKMRGEQRVGKAAGGF